MMKKVLYSVLFVLVVIAVLSLAGCSTNNTFHEFSNGEKVTKAFKDTYLETIYSSPIPTLTQPSGEQGADNAPKNFMPEPPAQRLEDGIAACQGIINGETYGYRAKLLLDRQFSPGAAVLLLEQALINLCPSQLIHNNPESIIPVTPGTLPTETAQPNITPTGDLAPITPSDKPTASKAP